MNRTQIGILRVLATAGAVFALLASPPTLSTAQATPQPTQKRASETSSNRAMTSKQKQWLKIIQQSKDAKAQQKAIKQLLKAKVKTASFIKALAGLSQHTELSSVAVKAMKAIGPTVYQVLSAQMRSKLVAERRSAAAGLAFLSPWAPTPPKIMPALLTALGDRDALVRRYTVGVLANMGASAKPAIPTLVKMLRDKSAMVAGVVASTLGTLALREGLVIPAFVAAFSASRSKILRIHLLQGISSFGAKGAKALPLLLSLLKSKDEDLHRHALLALGGIGAQVRAHTGALITSLKDKRQRIREAAAKALITTRPAPALAVPGLVTALQDKSYYVRLYASHALVNMGKKAAPALKRMMKTQRRHRDNIKTILRKISEKK